MAFSPDGERLASAGGDGTVKVWNSRTGKVIQTLRRAHAGFVVSVAFHPDGKHLASVGADQQVKVWDLTTGQAGVRPARATPFTRSGRRTPWRSARRRPTARGGKRRGGDGLGLEEPTNSFTPSPDTRSDPISVAFSRDGRRLASGSWRGSVKLWDAETGGRAAPHLPRRAIRHPVSALAFSPDGGRLAAASFDRRVDVWDTTTGELLHTLPHAGLVLGVAFSPDGRRLASAGEDKTVRVWDATTGREVLGLRGHTGMCGCVAFSPDGRRLASASTDGTIRVWDATPLRGDEGQEAADLPATRRRNLERGGQPRRPAGSLRPASARPPRSGTRRPAR